MLDAQMIEKLVNILEQEEKIYRDLHIISEKKRDLIINGKVPELDSLVRMEQALILNVGNHEDEREKIVEHIAVQLAIKPSEITLSSISKVAGDFYGQRLKLCQDRLATTINALKNTNDLNSKLIKNSLEYIDFSINLLSSAESDNSKYGNDGQYGSSKKRTFFDMKL
jgi:flagellar biosynthesis/type III secretory pathway chaperone